MKKIKLKFNYGGDFRVFDASLALINLSQNHGFVLMVDQMLSERYVFLDAGRYLAQAIYDMPKESSGKQTCVYEQIFSSEEINQININFKKPTSFYSGFSESDIASLGDILQETVGGRFNAGTTQTFAINTVKRLEYGDFLEERVVIDKNGKVEYLFSYNEQEVLDDDPRPVRPAVPISPGQALRWQQIKNEPQLRPYATVHNNCGHWDINTHGLVTNIGVSKFGYQDVRSFAYLRPRSQLLARLLGFIEENMALARRINGIVE